MAIRDDPDRDYERRMERLDEQRERELALERVEDHTPAADLYTPCIQPGAPKVTGAMVALANTILNGRDHDRRDAARVLAELVLEAS